MATDFDREGLLEGLGDEARKSRRRLLVQLEEDGVPLEELRAASAEGRLALLPVERALDGGSERLTADEVAERSGLPRAFLDRFWRALGMTLAEEGEAAFTERDLEASRHVKAFRDAGLDEAAILEITRVMSRSMTGVAVTVGAAFVETFLEAGDNEHELALRYAEASRNLEPKLPAVLGQVLRVQQLALIRQVAVDEAALRSGSIPGAREVTVLFADLVGFTKLGESVDASELGAVAERLEEIASSLANPPVRVVKTIGDEVMLSAPEPGPLVDVGLGLVNAADGEAEGFPQLRVGIACGEALARAGDWYGRPVNLASRITGVARPGSVLVSQEVKEALDDGYRFSFAGKRRIKGVHGEVALHRVRHAEEPGG